MILQAQAVVIFNQEGTAYFVVFTDLNSSGVEHATFFVRYVQQGAWGRFWYPGIVRTFYAKHTNIKPGG